MTRNQCFLLVFIALAGIFDCSWRQKPEDIWGQWKGVSPGGKEFYITIQKGNEIVMTSEGRTMPGVYSIDFSKKPIQMEVTNKFGANEKAIIEFLDKDHLRFETGGPSQPYPASFSEDRSYILRRVIEGNAK